MLLRRPPASELLALVLVGSFVLVQLCWPPLLGLANNGDFERLMHWGKLEYVTADAQEKYFGWINREFRITKNPLLAWRGLASSEALFVKLSALLSSLLLGGERFDLRVLGLVHLAAFLAALWLLLKGWRRSTGFPALLLLPGILFIFCDLGYTAYFHSLYSEPATLIFLLALVGAGLCLPERQQVRLRLVLVFGLSALLFVSAKAQNITLIPLLVLFAARLFFATPWRRAVVAFAALLLSAALLSYVLTTKTMREANRYNSVFTGILKDSLTPERDLRELGLPEQYAALAGTTIFDPALPLEIKSEEFRAGFFERVNHLLVVKFYLTHPARFWQKLQTAAARSYTLRPAHLGNFEKQSGAAYGAQAQRWSYWSSFKQHYAPSSLWFLLSSWLLLGLLIGQTTRAGLTREFCFSLWLMPPLAFVTPLLGEGEADLEKHLFLFNALCDLSLLLSAGLALGWCYQRLANAQQKMFVHW